MYRIKYKLLFSAQLASLSPWFFVFERNSASHGHAQRKQLLLFRLHEADLISADQTHRSFLCTLTTYRIPVFRWYRMELVPVHIMRFFCPKTVHTSRLYCTNFEHLVNFFPCSGDFIFIFIGHTSDIPERPLFLHKRSKFINIQHCYCIGSWTELLDERERISNFAKIKATISGVCPTPNNHSDLCHGIKCH